MQFPICICVFTNNNILILLLTSTFCYTVYPSPADIILECDKIVMKIYKNLTEQSGNTLLDAMNLHLSTVKDILKKLEKNDTSIFKECKPMETQSWLDYLRYDLTYEKIQELRHLFKWTEQETKYFKYLWRTADEKWNSLLEYCYDYLDRTGMMYRIKNSFSVTDDDTFSNTTIPNVHTLE